MTAAAATARFILPPSSEARSLLLDFALRARYEDDEPKANAFRMAAAKVHLAACGMLGTDEDRA